MASKFLRQCWLCGREKRIAHMSREITWGGTFVFCRTCAADRPVGCAAAAKLTRDQHGPSRASRVLACNQAADAAERAVA